MAAVKSNDPVKTKVVVALKAAASKAYNTPCSKVTQVKLNVRAKTYSGLCFAKVAGQKGYLELGVALVNAADVLSPAPAAPAAAEAAPAAAKKGKKKA